MNKLIVFALATVAAVTSGCVQDATSHRGIRGSAIKPLGTSALPASMLGLQVRQENVSSALAESQSAYVTALSLYSLRRGKQLAATLQISVIDTAAADRVPNFQGAVAESIGHTVPRVARLGTDRVYLSRGTKQQLAVWFRGPYLFVMSIREDYDQPRGLLRRALAIDPGKAT